MLEAITTFLGNAETWILALSASAWIYPALFVFACVDGFFPPIPSESVVIALSVLAASTGQPVLGIIVLVAAAGAWAGDQIAYSIGRAVGTDRLRLLRGERGRRAATWARKALAHRGASFILAARYIPVGRVAVNMTAGAVGYPRRRFMGLSALAAVMWAVYSVLIGLVAGEWLDGSPLLAMGVGVVAGMAMGVVLDRVLQAWTRRRPAPQKRVGRHAADDASDAGRTAVRAGVGSHRAEVPLAAGPLAHVK